jgi:hypothetical protein
MLGLRKLIKKFEGKDPENIKQALRNLSEDPNLPPVARRTVRKLLARYEKGQPLKASIKSEAKSMIKDLKENAHE